MKLIYAIVHSEDGNSVTEELNAKGFIVTKLATTGGFLRRGNVTLMIGTEEEKVTQAIKIIKRECGNREQVQYTMPYTDQPNDLPIAGYAASPVTVDVGGATIFVVDVERFEKV